jgi:hypothetical protein
MMFVNGQVQVGNPFYNAATNNGIAIVGGVADSIFYVSNQPVYVGYGERTGAAYNRFFVGNGGVLTNASDFHVGEVNNTQNSDIVAMSNQLVVADGGKMFLNANLFVGSASVARQANKNSVLISNGGLVSGPALSVGYANAAGATNNSNSVTLVNGGQLFTKFDSYVGRANNASGAIANNNSAWVTGANSQWHMGGKNLTVGFKTGTGVATGNVFSVSGGGVVTNVSALIVKAANTLSLGAGGLIAAGAVTNAGTLAVTIDGSQTPACGRLAVTGNLNVTGATFNLTVATTATDPCVIATYGSLTGGFSVTNGLSDKYRLDMNYKSENKIAIIYTAAGTLIQLK